MREGAKTLFALVLGADFFARSKSLDPVYNCYGKFSTLPYPLTQLKGFQDIMWNEAKSKGKWDSLTLNLFLNIFERINFRVRFLSSEIQYDCTNQDKKNGKNKVNSLTVFFMFFSHHFWAFVLVSYNLAISRRVKMPQIVNFDHFGPIENRLFIGNYDKCLDMFVRICPGDYKNWFGIKIAQKIWKKEFPVFETFLCNFLCKRWPFGEGWGQILQTKRHRRSSTLIL